MSDGKEKWFSMKESLHDRNSNLLLGSCESYTLVNDPKHTAFTLSRYKFCSKMILNLENPKHILEIGCSEGLGSLLLMQDLINCKYLGLDFDQNSIDHAQKHIKSSSESVDYKCLEFSDSTELKETFDAIVSLDVIEHIDTDKEKSFFRGIYNNISNNGIAIIGTPNKYAEIYQLIHQL